jgi:heme-degrading monooxygenase HmoA
MITRIVKMNFRSEEVENFLTIFHQSKDKIRHMPGCKHLELWNSQSDASIYYTYSIWDSEDDLNNYRDSELFQSVWPATKALFASKAEASSLNVLVKL